MDKKVKSTLVTSEATGFEIFMIGSCGGGYGGYGGGRLCFAAADLRGSKRFSEKRRVRLPGNAVSWRCLRDCHVGVSERL